MAPGGFPEEVALRGPPAGREVSRLPRQSATHGGAFPRETYFLPVPEAGGPVPGGSVSAGTSPWLVDGRLLPERSWGLHWVCAMSRLPLLIRTPVLWLRTHPRDLI